MLYEFYIQDIKLNLPINLLINILKLLINK